MTDLKSRQAVLGSHSALSYIHLQTGYTLSGTHRLTRGSKPARQLRARTLCASPRSRRRRRAAAWALRPCSGSGGGFAAFPADFFSGYFGGYSRWNVRRIMPRTECPRGARPARPPAGRPPATSTWIVSRAQVSKAAGRRTHWRRLRLCVCVYVH